MLRRFLPLLALLALSVATLLARLWDIQVVQHDVWATAHVEPCVPHIQTTVPINL